MFTLKGLAGGGGCAVGPLLRLDGAAEPRAEQGAGRGAEASRFHAAADAAAAQFSALYERTKESLGEEAAAIFQIHGMMLEDEDYLSAVYALIDQGYTADYAVYAASGQFAALFSDLEDAYMRARAADVLDLSQRLLTLLAGREEEPTAADQGPSVVAAEELLPSQTVQLDQSRVLAFLSRRGSLLSHASILARSMGVPFVTHLGEDFCRLQTGDTVVVDGDAGLVIAAPNAATRAEYEKKCRSQQSEAQGLFALRSAPTVTEDGAHIALCANLARPDQAAALAAGAEGVGLFRSEFLYLESHTLPAEEVQFAAYRSVLEAMAPQRVVIRTLDLGADKQAPWLKLPPEENPALGLRAVRLCLARPQLFLPQLRALLRASLYGRLAVMLPMVTSAEEVRAVRALMEMAAEQLKAEGVPHGRDFELGVMIETPAAVMMAAELSHETDFFSIGTNDLTQYTFAADRMNPYVAECFDPGSTAVLRMIRMAVETAHAAGRWVGICGESAADPRLIPYYVALGVDELSMSPGLILKTRALVRGLNRDRCREEWSPFLL